MIDTRTHTARAKREMINKHLFRDHGKISAKQGDTLEERYSLHRSLHEAGDCDHTHIDLDDLSAECAQYVSKKPLRVRVDRPPKNWTITYHLATDHNERIIGNTIAREVFHEELHSENPEGWAGIEGRVHRHLDIFEPKDTIEYLDEE